MTLNHTFCWKKSRTDADIIRNMEKQTVYRRERLACSRYARSDTWGKTETRGSHWFVYWIRIDFPWMAVPRLTCFNREHVAFRVKRTSANSERPRVILGFVQSRAWKRLSCK